LPIIDVSKNYPQKEIHLQSIADIEYVPLETTRTVLLDRDSRLSYLSDKYIVVWQRGQGDVFVFNRNGKIETHLNRKGRGDMEYNQMLSVIFDEKNEEIFVFDTPQTSRILVYSLTGEYKRTMKYDASSRMAAYNFDNETMLFYDESGLEQNRYKEKQCY